MITLEKKGPIAILTLNRPDAMNALGEPGDGQAVKDVCDQINADKTLRCAILTGAGKGFSAGGNVKAMRDRVGSFAGSPAEVRDNYKNGVHMIVRALYNLEIPLIAAVNGAAVGLGQLVLQQLGRAADGRHRAGHCCGVLSRLHRQQLRVDSARDRLPDLIQFGPHLFLLIDRHIAHPRAKSRERALLAKELNTSRFKSSFVMSSIKHGKGFRAEGIKLGKHGQQGENRARMMARIAPGASAGAVGGGNLGRG